MSKGFTLIELMITISIIAVLFGIVITSSLAVKKSSRDTQRQSDLQSIQSALQSYFGDQTTYPSSSQVSSGSPISSGNTTYLNKVPTDPVGSPGYCYVPYTSNPSSGGTSSPNCTGASPCLYYQLYANVENSSNANVNPSVNNPSGCTGTYNYMVTPP